MRSVVVLPAPLEPISATSSPGRDRQRHALQGPDVAVADVDVGRAQACRACPRYAAMTSGLARTAAGSPSAIEPPVVEDLDPVAQVHDQRDVVGDEDDRDPQLVAQPADEPQQLLRLDRVHAGVRLVEQQDPGLGRRPRARSRAGAGRRTAGCGPAGRAWPASPNSSSSSIARSSSSRSRRRNAGLDRSAAEQRARRRGAGRATLTLSRTDRSPNSRMFWNVRPMPSRDDLVGAASR